MNRHGQVAPAYPSYIVFLRPAPLKRKIFFYFLNYFCQLKRGRHIGALFFYASTSSGKNVSRTPPHSATM